MIYYADKTHGWLPSSITHVEASNNVGWGIHLYKSAYNTIAYCQANNVTRGTQHYTCDTAALLINCNCHHNLIHECGFTNSGDNIFMTGFPRQGQNECCPSNYNIIRDNQLTGSPNNAVECTFSTGNVIHHNILNGSNYGIWGGYSHDGLQITDNMIGGAKE